MPEILECVMLICFGLSWPISVVGNFKSRTAKGMNLPFILLITFGYVAGIAAKFISGNVNYVLIVYLFNIVAVLLNIIVYFRNLHIDKVRMAKQREIMLENVNSGKALIKAELNIEKAEKKFGSEESLVETETEIEEAEKDISSENVSMAKMAN